jgi:RimJ/RimL family protein N-acetyltransferase
MIVRVRLRVDEHVFDCRGDEEFGVSRKTGSVQLSTSSSAQRGGHAEFLAHRTPYRLRRIAAVERLVHSRAEHRHTVVSGHRPRVGRPEPKFHPLPEVAQSHPCSLSVQWMVAGRMLIGWNICWPKHLVVGKDRDVTTPSTQFASPASEPARWYCMDTLTGDKVNLVPLQYEQASGYLNAANVDGGAAEVFRWLSTPAPATLEQAQQHIAVALTARARGERLAYAQLDAGTGHVIGTSSYYEINPDTRAIGIGYTWLGTRWWRTGHNTESKLLMLSHAFDTLGAARVVWHTDIFNLRSQSAIERLGATREGIIRKHRIRADQSWRDTVQYSMTDEDWPTVRGRLTARLLET